MTLGQRRRSLVGRPPGAAVRVGDFVRTREALAGIARGPSAAHGDGQSCEVPSGAVCEVYDIEEGLGWVTVHFDLEDSGPNQPYFCEAITTQDKLAPASRPPLPPIIPEGPQTP